MTMNKLILMIAAIAFSAVATAQSKNQVIIKGTLNGDLKGYNKMYLYTRTTNDSAEIKDGHYTFSFPFVEPVLKILYPEYIKEQGMIYQPYGLLISEPGIYKVISDIMQALQASVLKGPAPMMLYNKFQEDFKDAYKKINPQLEKLYGNEWYKTDEKSKNYTAIQNSTDSLRNVFILPVIEDLVKKHPASYASAYVLSGQGKQIGSIQQKEALYNMLSPKIKKTTKAQDYYDYILGLKSSDVGSIVSDFILPDPENKMINFAGLKGKYVLIDFWASWCWPCRKSFPHMREVYKKYKGDQFEIYSISIDESKPAWLKAVKEENNPWIQSLDTKNISQSAFAVTAVPSTFLIDPNGKILEKEVGFDPDGNGKIENKLKELFPDR